MGIVGFRLERAFQSDIAFGIDFKNSWLRAKFRDQSMAIFQPIDRSELFIIFRKFILKYDSFITLKLNHFVAPGDQDVPVWQDNAIACARLA